MSTQRGGPRPGHLPDAHRLPARRPDPLSVAWRPGVEGTGTAGADMPGFVSIATNRALSPEAFGSGFLGPAIRSAPGRRERQHQPAAAERHRPAPQGAKPRPARRRGRQARRRPGASCWTTWRRISSRNGPAWPDRPSHGLPRAVTLMNSSSVKAFNLARGAEGPARLPMAATCSARPACWPAAWSSAACPSSRSTSTAGTRTSRTSSGQAPRRHP